MNAQEILPFRSAPAAPKGDGLTVADVVCLYLQHDVKLGPEARDQRKRKLDVFCAELGSLPVAECRPSDLESWLARIAARWPAAATRRSANAGIQRAFNWAVRDRRLAENPFRGVVVDEEEETGRAMTDAEFDALFAASSLPFRRVLRFLDLTGCRPCELCALEWEMIDVDKSVATMKRHKTAKKTGRPRTIYLPPEALELTAEVLAEQEAVGMASVSVFTNSRGSRWTRANLSNRMQDLRPRTCLPVDCVLYGVRHRYATRAAVRGCPLKTLAELLGHSSTRTTERYYLHLGEQHEHMAKAAASVLGRLGR